MYSIFSKIFSVLSFLGGCSILMHWKSYTKLVFDSLCLLGRRRVVFVPLLVSILLEIEPFLDEDATPSLNCWNIWVDLFLSVSSKTTTKEEMMAPFPILLSYWTRNKIFLYSMLPALQYVDSPTHNSVVIFLPWLKGVKHATFISLSFCFYPSLPSTYAAG